MFDHFHTNFLLYFTLLFTFLAEYFFFFELYCDIFDIITLYKFKVYDMMILYIYIYIYCA